MAVPRGDTFVYLHAVCYMIWNEERTAVGLAPGRPSERVGRGGDRVEIGAGVRAEAPEVEVGVVLDPAHRDLERLAVALLGLGTLASREDVGELVGMVLLDQRGVIRGAAG